MKRTLLYIAFAFSGYINAQTGVGINTLTPEATLDVNGNMIIR